MILRISLINEASSGIQVGIRFIYDAISIASGAGRKIASDDSQNRYARYGRYFQLPLAPGEVFLRRAGPHAASKYPTDCAMPESAAAWPRRTGAQADKRCGRVIIVAPGNRSRTVASR